MKIRYMPSELERVIYCILSVLHIVNGIYLIGPWYLDETEIGKAPLITMFNSDVAVSIYGVLLFINGIALLYASFGRGRRYLNIVKGALLSGFLLRLYALIGVFLTINSWRPPSYLSHIATVAIIGAMWVWVKINERIIE